MGTCIFIARQDLEKTLAIKPEQGKRLLPWQLSGAEELPCNVLEDTNVSSKPEVHETEGDYWECLQGTITFTVEGELINPRQVKENEWQGDGIKGGREIIMKSGERLYIPPGTPHSHEKLDGTARLMITKI